MRATWETLDENCGLKSATQAVKAYESLRKLMDPKKKEKKRGRRAKVVIEVRGGNNGSLCHIWGSDIKDTRDLTITCTLGHFY